MGINYEEGGLIYRSNFDAGAFVIDIVTGLALSIAGEVAAQHFWEKQK